jgi:hypothetical protein
VRLAPQGLLQLEPHEAADLCQEFNRVFANSGRELAVRAGELLLLGEGLAPPGVDPAQWLGRDLREAWAQVGDSRAWRAWHSECELWLHGSTFNTLRRRASRVPVTQLWFWDAPLPPPRSAPSLLAAGSDVYTAAAWLVAAAATAALTPRPPPTNLSELPPSRDAVVVLSAFADRADGLGAVLERWVLPALEQLQRGAIDVLHCIFGKREFELRAVQRWHLWRAVRPWPQRVAS